MESYHSLVNLDKKQVVPLHQIGHGLKPCEQIDWEHSTSTARVMALASREGGGGAVLLCVSNPPKDEPTTQLAV